MVILPRLCVMCALLAWGAAAAERSTAADTKQGCTTAEASPPKEPAGPPKKSDGSSGTTGWSGSLGGSNIPTEGGGTRDTKQTNSEAVKGLDPKPDGKKPPC